MKCKQAIGGENPDPGRSSKTNNRIGEVRWKTGMIFA